MPAMPTSGVTRSRSDRVATALDARWLRAVLARVPAWRGVLTLNYHRVGDSSGQPWDRTLWSTTAEGFDEQLAYLGRHAQIVGPSDLAAVATSGRGRFVALTFDDGYRDNYEIAYPLLRRHGVEAAFFLATGFLDDPHVAWWDEIAWMVRRAERSCVAAGEWLAADVPLTPGAEEAAIATLVHAYKAMPAERTNAYLDHLAEATGAGRCGAGDAADLWMTWEMARELRDGGMTIGGHTVTHPVLAQLPADAQEREIAGCAGRLQEELGEPMRWFAYPVGFRGSFTDVTQAILARYGVELAFSFYGGYARYSQWEPLDIPRIHVGPQMDRRLLQASWRLPQLFARPD